MEASGAVCRSGGGHATLPFRECPVVKDAQLQATPPGRTLGFPGNGDIGLAKIGAEARADAGINRAAIRLDISMAHGAIELPFASAR